MPRKQERRVKQRRRWFSHGRG